MASYKVFVINLARSNERLANIKAQLDAINVPFERIDAVDGAQLTDQDIEQIAPKSIIENHYFRPLGKGEIACALSHKKAWQQIIDDDLDFAIILEDDLELLENFSKTIELLASVPTSYWEFIKLFPLRKAGKSNIAQSVDLDDHTLIRYHKFPLSCVAQAVTKQAAIKMVSNLQTIKEPIDSQLKAWWELDILPFGLTPYCVTTNLAGKSDINPTGELEKLQQNKWIKFKTKVFRGFGRMRANAHLEQKFSQLVQYISNR